MSSSDVRDQMMREMTPTMSSSEGAPSVKVDEITYRGDVPMSPASQIKLAHRAKLAH